MAIKDTTNCLLACESDLAYNTGTTQATQLQTVKTWYNQKTGTAISDLVQPLACCRPIWGIDPADGLPFIRYSFALGRSPWDTTNGTFTPQFMHAAVTAASWPGGSTSSKRFACVILARVSVLRTYTGAANTYLWNMTKLSGSGTDWYQNIGVTGRCNISFDTPSPIVPVSNAWAFYTYRGGFTGAEGGYRFARDQYVWAPNNDISGSNDRDCFNLGFLNAQKTGATIAADGVTLTLTGAFANYTWTSGDQIRITGGTNVTTGLYTISSKTNDNTIVLSSDCTSDSSSHSDVKFEGVDANGYVFADFRAVWIGGKNGAIVPDSEVASVVSTLETKYGASSAKTRRVFLLTDSLGIQNATESQTLAVQLGRRLSATWDIFADCQPGRRLTAGTDPAIDAVSNVIVPLRNTAMLWEGVVDTVSINDLRVASATGAGTWTSKQTVGDAVIAGGMAYIPGTCQDCDGGLATGGSNAAFATERLAYNTLVRTGSYPIVSDVGSMPQIGARYASCGTSLYFDGSALETSRIASTGGALHKSNAGIGLEADCVARAVLRASGSTQSVTWENVLPPVTQPRVFARGMVR